MIEQTINEFCEHAAAEFPRESCGLIIIFKGKERYLPCRNVAQNPNTGFELHAEDYARAEDMGEIIGVCHSHPNANNNPTESDLTQCEESGVEWHIVTTTADGCEGEPYNFKPTGFRAPLVGRSFYHGVLDCYTLIRDWYQQERGITLPNYTRLDNWWNNGQNLYMDNFADAGFELIKGPMQVGDVIIMQIRGDAPNHAGVYIGDGLMLHHMVNRLSTRDLYDGYFQENTRCVVRYKNGN